MRLFYEKTCYKINFNCRFPFDSIDIYGRLCENITGFGSADPIRFQEDTPYEMHL